MCHSCGSRNPGCFALAMVFLEDNRGPGTMAPSLDDHFRGNATLGVPPGERRGPFG